MRIIADKAEKRFKLHIPQIEPDIRYAVYFQFTLLKKNDQNIQHIAKSLALLEERLHKFECLLFQFTDQDMVLLTQLDLTVIEALIGEIRFLFTDDPASCNSQFIELKTIRDNKNALVQMAAKKALLAGQHNEVIIEPLPVECSLDLLIFNDVVTGRNKRKAPEILLVEDHPFSRDLTARIIKKSHRVHVAENVKDAITLYTKIAPDMVFLDIELPDYNGLQFLQHIMVQDKKGFVVMLTGHNCQKYLQKAIQLGAKGYITKPFSPTKIEFYIQLFHQKKSVIVGG